MKKTIKKTIKKTLGVLLCSGVSLCYTQCNVEAMVQEQHVNQAAKVYQPAEVEVLLLRYIMLTNRLNNPLQPDALKEEFVEVASAYQAVFGECTPEIKIKKQTDGRHLLVGFNRQVEVPDALKHKDEVSFQDIINASVDPNLKYNFAQGCPVDSCAILVIVRSLLSQSYANGGDLKRMMELYKNFLVKDGIHVPNNLKSIVNYFIGLDGVYNNLCNAMCQPRSKQKKLNLISDNKNLILQMKNELNDKKGEVLDELKDESKEDVKNEFVFVQKDEEIKNSLSEYIVKFNKSKADMLEEKEFTIAAAYRVAFAGCTPEIKIKKQTDGTYRLEESNSKVEVPAELQQKDEISFQDIINASVNPNLKKRFDLFFSGSGFNRFLSGDDVLNLLSQSYANGGDLKIIIGLYENLLSESNSRDNIEKNIRAIIAYFTSLEEVLEKLRVAMSQTRSKVENFNIASYIEKFNSEDAENELNKYRAENTAVIKRFSNDNSADEPIMFVGFSQDSYTEGCEIKYNTPGYGKSIFVSNYPQKAKENCNRLYSNVSEINNILPDAKFKYAIVGLGVGGYLSGEDFNVIWESLEHGGVMIVGKYSNCLNLKWLFDLSPIIVKREDNDAIFAIIKDKAKFDLEFVEGKTELMAYVKP